MTLLKLTLGLLIGTFSMTTIAQNGLITIQSQHTVDVTADRFEQLVKDKGLTFFLRIDHAMNAKNAELTLRPTQVILFGNPVAGTALMNCEQSIAIDLPQKALFWQDENGKSWVSYNDPYHLRDQHNMKGCEPVLEKISGLLSALTSKAAQE